MVGARTEEEVMVYYLNDLNDFKPQYPFKSLGGSGYGSGGHGGKSYQAFKQSFMNEYII